MFYEIVTEISGVEVRSEAQLIETLTEFSAIAEKYTRIRSALDEVEATGTKIVMKNNRPACILMSPSQYENLMEMLSDYIMREEAEHRMSDYDPAKSLTQEEMMKELGVAAADLDEIDVEIE